MVDAIKTDILKLSGIDVSAWQKQINEKKAAREEEIRRVNADPSILFPIRAQAEIEHAEWSVAMEEERRKNSIARLQYRGVPPRVAVVLAFAKKTEACDAVAAWKKGSLTFLVLAGGVGCGKTVAACVNPPEEGFLFVDALELVKAGLYGDKAEAFWESAQKAKLLVLDDLGTEPRDEKGYAACAFEDLMNKRYNSMRKTILTTNLTAEAFKARYCEGSGGGRFGDRLRECGDWVALTGGSMRTKK